MTESQDVFGLGGILPGPGWVVLDAARTHRFTGEVIMRGDTEVRIYLDRGRIYVAERQSDPPLGTRLVEAGALNQAQLDYGTLRIGDIEHLGRLFDRVPSINRDGVLVINQLMTDECVRAVAGQRITTVTVTPYRHHPSGMHRWEVIRDVEAVLASEVPEMALPAPPPDATPVSEQPPTELERLLDHLDHAEAAPTAAAPDSGGGADRAPRHAEPDDAGGIRSRRPTGGGDGLVDRPLDPLFDDLVRWDEPSRLDQAGLNGSSTTGSTTTSEPVTANARVAPEPDWIDRLDEGGVANAPVGAPAGRLTPLAVRARDHFEIVWPSGETIDVTPDDAPPSGTDADRAGPTARVGAVDEPEPAEPATEPTTEPATESTTASTTEPEPAPAPDDCGTNGLAIRRAVATIDTGSLEARRRLVHATSPDTAPELPSRLAMRNEHTARSMTVPTSTSSVFDEIPLEIPDPDPVPEPTVTDEHGRAGALRRLIDSLRGN